jgi:hypothetical protein
MLDVKRLCLVAVAILFTVNGAPVRAQDLPVAGRTQLRSFTASHFALEIDGAFAGFMEQVEGGNAFSDVVEEPLSPALSFRKKHIANPGYRAVTLEVGSDMRQPLADWIKATFNGSFQRKNGAIVAIDFTSTERRRVEFFNALITEVGLPALDAASKDAAKITIVLEPEYTRRVDPHPGKYAGQLCNAKQKAWLTSNFRLTIDGVDTSKTRAIDAPTMTVVFQEGGEGRDFGREPAYVSFSNVIVELPESAAQSFDQWFENFVIQGNAGDDQEKGGTLEYLTPNLSSPVLTLTFSHLGIFELAPNNAAANDQIKTLVAKMYVESMAFNLVSPCGN